MELGRGRNRVADGNSKRRSHRARGLDLQESIKVVKLRRRGRPAHQENNKPDDVRFKFGNGVDYLTARIARDRNRCADSNSKRVEAPRAGA